jgi:lipopolysaccharide transport system permease protein
MSSLLKNENWKEVISSENRLFSINLKELWEYRDLLQILVRRDILAIYKQTVLGPIWFFLQPLLTTLTYIVIFARVAKMSTSGLPASVFYLSGIVLWSYFSECIIRTSTFFKDNTPILSKVYFPRLIIPLSLIMTNLVKFLIQLTLFFIVYLYFMVKGTALQPNIFALLLPVLVLLTAGLGLGLGIIVSSLTTRYKDLVHLITFGVQLLMFTSTVIFPMSGFENSRYKILIMANPMTGIIEAFRYGFLGQGYFSWPLLAYDTAFVAVSLFCGVIIFNSVEKNFVDSI